jgi:prepilin peptidase CpaA
MYLIALLAVAAATVVDLRRREIPNWISAGLLVVALVASLWGSVPPHWSERVLGLALASALTLPLFARGVLGGGDVKLFMALGAILGWKASIPFLIATGLAGGLIGLVARRLEWRELPYAPAMLLGLLGLLPLVLLR